jgi:hypothetical protein
VCVACVCGCASLRVLRNTRLEREKSVVGSTNNRQTPISRDVEIVEIYGGVVSEDEKN